jgi:peptide/nickel transport system substrate-binding protein
MLRNKQLVIGVATLAAFSVGLTAAASANVAATKPTLTIAADDACPGNLNPAGLNPDWYVRYAVYETLLKPSQRKVGESSSAPRPGLATSWRIFPGNKRVELTLRRNTRFSDGTLLDARAAKVNLDYQTTDPEGANTQRQIGPVRSIDVISKYVLRITLKSPNPDIIGALENIRIASPKAVAEIDGDPKSNVFNRQTWGIGAYKLNPSQTVLGDHCTYVPNPLYYDKSKQRWGKIVTRVIADPNTVLSAMRTGQVDFTWQGSALTARAAASAGLRVIHVPGEGGAGGLHGLYFLDKGGVLQKALADVRVRRALNYAVDRKTIVAGLYGRYATPTSVPNHGSEGHDPKYVNYYSYNPARAKALLAAAGYPNGFKLSALSLGPAGGFRHDPMAQAIAKYLAAVGVDMEIYSAQSVAERNLEFGKRKYSALLSTIGRISMYQWYNFALVPGQTRGDQHGWRDPVIDRLYLKAQRLDAAKAKKLWQQLLTRAVTQAYFLPISSEGLLVYASKRVGGISVSNWYHNPAEWNPAAS